MSNSPSISSSASGGVFDAAVIDDRPAQVTIQVSGSGADSTFADEAGGHRWQRVPPNERHGRVHTSTVTVAVMPEPPATELVISPGDIEWKACRGSGAGGQHRNVTDSAVQVFHRPSGLTVRCESERSQHQNRASALALLRARLWGQERARLDWNRAASRKAQIGSGMRGDKRRTIRLQDGVVTDHVLGRRWRLKDYLRGEW